jgi:hypothetical protein
VRVDGVVEESLSVLELVCVCSARCSEGVVQSLQNKGVVECLISSTCTASGWDATTHLYRIADFGRKVLDASPTAYLRTVTSSSTMHVDLTTRIKAKALVTCKRL